MRTRVIRNISLIALAVGLFFLGGLGARIEVFHGHAGDAVLGICWVFSLAILLVLGNDGIIYLERLTARHPASNLCRHCGYDIRASKERCPECGNAIVPQAEPRGVT